MKIKSMKLKHGQNYDPCHGHEVLYDSKNMGNIQHGSYHQNNYKLDSNCKRCKTFKQIQDLITRERTCLLNPHYLTNVQQNCITPRMRTLTLDWMFELVDNIPDMHSSVYPAACCVFDRYLSNQPSNPNDLQDIALSAILYVSKIYETTPLKIRFLENYFRINKLKLIEHQFENALQIKQCCMILPTQYYPLFLQYSQVLHDLEDSEKSEILSHSQTLLPVFMSDYNNIIHAPSVIGGACLLESISHLYGDPDTCYLILQELSVMINSHPCYLLKAVRDLRKSLQKVTHSW